MVSKPIRRNRRSNVAVPLDLSAFIHELARATNWRGDLPFGRGSQVTPGEFSSREDVWDLDDPGRFSVNYLFEQMLTKYDDGLPSPEKEATTWKKFAEAEEMCRNTNIRLIYDKSRHTVYDDSFWSLIEAARRKIHRLLGEFSWNDASTGFSFGPGATTRLPRKRADAVYKYSGKPDTTPGNSGLAEAAICSSPLWQESVTLDGGSLYNVVKGNRIVTVPKNYKAHRVIAIEPCMNMYIQKGIGRVIRKRLKRVGVDLDDQSRNQYLAQCAVGKGLATVDLSMASDTISYELVRILLPPEWMSALEQCRSPIGVLPSGEQILYRKFSSMGNGYTFELESLIFWAITRSVVEACGADVTSISIYGDDIILPVEAVPTLMDTLSWAGFKTNVDKTFADGMFRESCGKHYFNGFDVTPFYVRGEPKALRVLFLLHNQLYRWCLRNTWNTVWDRGLMRSLLMSLRSKAPSSWRRPRLPDGLGDGAFIGTFDEAMPSSAYCHKRGWEGFRVQVLVDETSTEESDLLGRYLKSLVQLEARPKDSLLWNLEVLAGGVAKPPRARQQYTIVPRFSTLDPFEI
jgi:hypothetical protein